MTDVAIGAARRPALDPLPERVLELIHDRGLRPGDPMPTELELIELLGVSRNSVREAVRSLRALGIVDVRHGHGTVVGEASLHVLSPSLAFRAVAGGDDLAGLRNLIEVRELIEVGVAGRLAGELDESTLDRLDALCTAMDETELDPETDREFHRLLYARVDNPLIGQLVDVFWDAYRTAHDALSAPGPAEKAETVRLHSAIVEALRAGDAAAAREAMAAHFAEINHRLGFDG
ncbi:FadR/GntR family transcriptional regulator [Saccharopolyspora gregorii]|uniref:FadR/GntR family transcriptional regulator n=1 Tax=Saccharopolyspora gregorii TaxID=33914 RepID=A0ABP6RXP9_9PSEU